MPNLSRHLTGDILFRYKDNPWKKSYSSILWDDIDRLTIDPAAVLGILSFGYATGERTLFNEIKMSPWLSEVKSDHSIDYHAIPDHGFYWNSYDFIAEELISLLSKELEVVCEGKKKIIILLTGGLDSRIAAGLLAKLHSENKIPVKPLAVTWGIDDCRDVLYAKSISTSLGLEWKHIKLSEEDLFNNTIYHSITIGGMTVPGHLHKMSWFNTTDSDTIIIAASYGNSVGRGEFSGRHLFDLEYLRPSNIYNLMSQEYFIEATKEIQNDFQETYRRCKQNHKYIHCEVALEGHYMRKMLHNVMHGLSKDQNLYQIFTAPSVYEFIWSIHPCLRNNNIYKNVLKKLHPCLSSVPWQKTGKKLDNTINVPPDNIQKDFHHYKHWASTVLYDQLKSYLDFNLLDSLTLFNMERIKKLDDYIRLTDSHHLNSKNVEIWLWLISFCNLIHVYEDQGIIINSNVTKRDNMRTISLPNTDGLYFKSVIYFFQKKLKLKIIINKFNRIRLYIYYLVRYSPIHKINKILKNKFK